MFDDHYLCLLRCPIDGQPLSIAPAYLVRLVSERLKETANKPHRDQASSRRRMDGGLVRGDGRLMYPIVDGIPRLLADAAIDLEQLGIARDKSKA